MKHCWLYQVLKSRHRHALLMHETQLEIFMIEELAKLQIFLVVQC